MFSEFLKKNVDITMKFIHYDPEDGYPNVYVHVYRDRGQPGWNMSLEYPYKEDFDKPKELRHTILPRKDYKNISTTELKQFLDTFVELPV
jgi:hypothetical protein